MTCGRIHNKNKPEFLIQNISSQKDLWFELQERTAINDQPYWVLGKQNSIFGNRFNVTCKKIFINWGLAVWLQKSVEQDLLVHCGEGASAELVIEVLTLCLLCAGQILTKIGITIRKHLILDRGYALYAFLICVIFFLKIVRTVNSVYET